MTVVFVSDYYAEDFTGGAELTTKALLESTEQHIIKLYSHQVDYYILNLYKEFKWIITNFSRMRHEVKLFFAKNISYSIIEYDYKFCKYRSLDLHREAAGEECDCKDDINNIFYGYAEVIWFMSEKQRDLFLSNVWTIKKEKTKILSSCFEDSHLNLFTEFRMNKKEHYCILDSNSKIKNTTGCIEYAKNNNLDFKLLKNLSYDKMLLALAESRGLIFLPLGADTCPRITIEAKLLDCELILNDNVQHKDEAWFSDKESILDYLRENKKLFWRFYDR